VSTRRLRRRVLLVVGIGGGVLVVLLLLFGGDGVSTQSMIRAFSMRGGMELVISGGGTRGTDTVAFDGHGNYESIVSGSVGGELDGTLLSVGGREYLRAPRASLEHRLSTSGTAISLAVADRAAREFSSTWIAVSDGGRGSAGATPPTSARWWLRGLGGTGSARLVGGALVSGPARLVLGKGGAPVEFSYAGKKGTLIAYIFYGNGVSLHAPGSLAPAPPIVARALSTTTPAHLSPYSVLARAVAGA
jgi:hypothetical protein